MKHITSPQGIDHLVDAYQQHLRHVKGLAPNTCANYAREVQEFLTLQWKKAGGDLVLARLGGENLLKYLTRQRSRCQPVSLQYLASTLRSFLRFLALSGQCPAELVHAVPKIQAGPRIASPHYLSEAQLQRLLASFDPQIPRGARDQGGAPLSNPQVSRLTAVALRRANLIFPRLGAQLLRRTFATHLTQRGTSVKAVADLLGHRYLNCTQLYAHVNLPMLQEVAQPWPEVTP